MHVCVLGAGIVGLATAWQLERQGHQVTVIDRAAPGAGASGGNGAQLSYSYVQPLADPSIWKQLPKLLLSPTSPLKLRPQLDPLQWRWGMEFLAACNAQTSRDTTAKLLALAASSRTEFEAMQADIAPDCDFSATGKLVLYASAASLEGARAQLELQRTMGSEQRIVTPDECIAIEPALASYRGQMAGAVHTPSECAADCLKVCAELMRALQCARRALHARHRRARLCAQWPPPRGSEHQPGDMEADAFVMALGRPRTGSGARWAPTCRCTRSRATASRWRSTLRPARHRRERDGQRAQGGVRAHRLAIARGRHGRTGGARREHSGNAHRDAGSRHARRLPACEPARGTAPLDRHAARPRRRGCRSSGGCRARRRTCCSTPATARWVSRWPSARRTQMARPWRPDARPCAGSVCRTPA
jgi:glycine/D-amino acid oxidase-like deaminating enzyme